MSVFGKNVVGFYLAGGHVIICWFQKEPGTPTKNPKFFLTPPFPASKEPPVRVRALATQNALTQEAWRLGIKGSTTAHARSLGGGGSALAPQTTGVCGQGWVTRQGTHPGVGGQNHGGLGA